MSLIELKAEVPATAADKTDALLLEWEQAEWSVLEDVIARRAWLVGIFPGREALQASWQELQGRLAAEGIAVVGLPVDRELADQDWKESYKAHFKAWKFGALNWVPVWERGTFALPAGEKALWLDPGMAFGTGNHETTRLCCERLVAFCAERGAAGRVLDAGCGSGILALSAAKLGFTRIVAFDNDPLAVAVSRENAELNGSTGGIEFHVADLVSGLAGRQADLVLANIQADVLMRFARELCAAVAPGGSLVLSGILRHELAQVREAFGSVASGWIVDSRTLGEWSDLVFVDPAARLPESSPSVS